MLRSKFKTFAVLALASVFAITLSLFGLSLDKPNAFVFAEGETSSMQNDEKDTESTSSIYVAKIGDKSYSTLKEAFAAAQKGETVTMIADYTVESVEDEKEARNIVSVDMVLDLNGHKIKYPAEMSEYNNNFAVISVDGGATLTVKDGGEEGEILSALEETTTGKNIGPYTFDVISGSLVIDGGHYVGGGTVAQVRKGTVTVNDGDFEVNPFDGPYYSDYMMNCIDGNYLDGSAKIIINGGAFRSWDPFNSKGDVKDGVNARFTAEGVGITEYDNEYYVAASGMVAQLTDKNGNSVKAFKTLKEAFATARKGETVTMIADYTVKSVKDEKEARNIVSVDTVLDLNGHTIKYPAEMSEYDKNFAVISVDGGATLTVKDGGKTGKIISASEETTAGKNIGPYTFDVISGALVIDGGHYVGGGTVAQVSIGKITINDGVFEVNPDATDGFDYMFECVSRDYVDGRANIAVNGGSFKGWDPFNSKGNMKDGVNARFTAEGVGVTKDDNGNYVAVSGMVAQVTDENGNSVEAFATLKEAFAAAKKSETVTLIADVTLTEQIDVVSEIVKGFTFDGGNHTITCATTEDPSKSGGSALYFGNANDKVYCSGIKIKNLNMTGKARFGIFLCGGTTTEFTNVNISGEYLYAINLYGTHGGTFTDCNITNSLDLGTENANGAAVWSNVASANPVVLNNTKISIIAINEYTKDNKLEPKIFVGKGSETVVHSLDHGSVSHNKTLCVNPESVGKYKIYEYVDGKAEEIAVAKNDNTGKVYTSLSEAVKEATAGDEISLLANTFDYVVIDKNLTINLGNYYLSNNCSVADSGAIYVKSGDLIVKAENGGIYGGAGSSNRAFFVENGTLTVYGGNYSVGADADGLGNSTVYVKGSGIVTIYDGYFSTESSYNDFYYVLNLNNKATGTFVVYGGVFAKYNPATGDDKLGGNFLAKGRKSVENEDGEFEVLKCSSFEKYFVNLGSSVTMKIGVNEVGENVKVTYTFNGVETEAAKEDGYYLVKGITPQIIDRVYTIKLYEGDEVVAVKDVSVVGYCDQLLASEDGAKAKEVVTALLFYGKEAKAYRGMEESEAINEIVEKYDLKLAEAEKPQSTAKVVGDAIVSKITLNVSDTNAIVYAMTKDAYAKIYGTESGCTVKVNDKTVLADEWVESGDLYIYTGESIYASDLSKKSTLVIEGKFNQTVEYGAYDYCARKWDTDGVKGLVRSIYAYAVACADYIAK